MHYILFMQSSTDVYLDCFHVLWESSLFIAEFVSSNKSLDFLYVAELVSTVFHFW